MAGEEGLADALVTVAIEVCEREAPFAGRAFLAEWNEGTEFVVGRVAILPAVLAEGLREPRRLNRPAQRCTKSVAFDRLRLVQDDHRADAIAFRHVLPDRGVIGRAELLGEPHRRPDLERLR